ncbi:MAG: hypothetical protein H6667_04110 [Ardenticatenaceae bacterium]|nr:hypothetical protein [Ardenticatenaceae bacterium]MCB9446087.1 hypothetical protein [Ardenticatenaceae bacterium]
MSRHIFLIIGLVLLTLVSCTTVEPTAVPSIPTTVITVVATPTLAPVQPTNTTEPTAVPAAAPTATQLPPPTAVPNANTDDLLALVQAGLSANAFDGLAVLPLYAPWSERPLWAVHSTGFRNYDLNPVPSHFIAIYTYENGRWIELARQNLNPENDETIASPDILPEGTVTQVGIDPAYVWLAVDGGVGAHGGAFELLRFDGTALHIEVTGSSASPGVGYLEDLNKDGTPDLILRQHEAYVFCYACGVRYLYFQVFTWDATNQQMVEVSIQPMLMGQQGHPARQPTNRAVELANAGLWADALAQIDEAQRIAATTTEPTDTYTLEWDTALIHLYYDAWQAELDHTPYPLLSRVFFGDYAGALAIMRPYSHEQIFSAGTPLIKGTMAEGYEAWVGQYILDQTNGAIAAEPDLAAAYYLRAWANFLLNPANSQIQSDLEQAKTLEPNEPLFGNTAVPSVNRIQFAPGATSATINSQVPAEGTAVYVLGASADQIMTIDLFTDDIDMYLDVKDSTGSWLDGQITTTMWQGNLPQTGDYVIRLLGGHPYADFTLRVTIPSRIQFALGTTSTTVQGDLAAYESDDYILGAQAGQTMTVNITSPNNNVLLTIVGADGVPLTNGLMSGASEWQGQLPATQDYIIRALGTEQPAAYTLDVSIK